MRIKSVEVRQIKVPYGPDGFRPSWLPGVTQHTYAQTLIRLYSDEGHIGFASTNCFGPEVYEFAKKVAPALLAREFNSKADLNQAWTVVKDRANKTESNSMLGRMISGAFDDTEGRTVRWSTVLGNTVGHPHKIPLMRYKNVPLDHRHWFINVALWDLYSRSQEQSIAESLGKERERVQAYASTGELVDERSREFVDVCREQGLESIKLRVESSDPTGRELKQIRSIIEETPDQFTVGIDANQGWSVLPPYWSYSEARQFAQVLESLDTAWLEEPLGCLNTDNLRRLTRLSDLEIVGGELESGPDRQREIVDCYDVINPDVCMSIGFSEGLGLADYANDHRTDFTPHTWGLGPSLAAGLQLVCAIPECDRLEYPWDPAWPVEYRDAILKEPLRTTNGDLVLPDEPGLGVELDPDAVSDFTVDKHFLGPPV